MEDGVECLELLIDLVIDGVFTRSHDRVCSTFLTSNPHLNVALSTTEPTSHTAGPRQLNHRRCLDRVV